MIEIPAPKISSASSAAAPTKTGGRLSRATFSKSTGVGVAVGVTVGVGVAVGSGVAVGTAVAVGGRVGVAVGASVAVGVTVGSSGSAVGMASEMAPVAL